MPKFTPIITEIGTLNGRNAIYLDKVELSEHCNTLKLSGEVSCPLASKPPPARWQAYNIQFCGVLAFQMIELDTWESLQDGNWTKTCFDEVLDSPWLARMRGKATPIIDILFS